MTNPHDTQGEQPAGFTDPPEPPECKYCEGSKVVEVVTVYAVGFKEDQYWPGGKSPDHREIPCPWCQR